MDKPPTSSRGAPDRTTVTPIGASTGGPDRPRSRRGRRIRPAPVGEQWWCGHGQGEEGGVGEEGEDSEEEESEEEEEYEEEEELEEKVFCYAITERKAEQTESRDPPVQLTCNFQKIVLEGVYPREDFVLVNKGVYFGGSFCHWDYF